MSKDFHERAFDDNTELKLEIFRGYIREWLPVFLSKKIFSQIYIYDFFAGPGKDKQGKIGSPLIIVEELIKYLNDSKTQKAEGVSVTLYFNEFDSEKYKNLYQELKQFQNLPFHFQIENKDFSQAFKDNEIRLRCSNAAKLVILDQCGIRQITPEIFQKLSRCDTTDIIFFISSSIIKRFCGEPCIQQYFPSLSEKKIKDFDSTLIHRMVCQYYMDLIPQGQEYYVAPFSIKKGANIYGLIFGTSNLLGLNKFLEVCWNQDTVTGEANYNIDGDFSWDGQLSLFDEDNIPRKKDKFKRDLIEKIRKGRKTNNDIFQFALENGFLPKHVNDIFKDLQNKGKLIVHSFTGEGKIKKNAFYINWDFYKTKKNQVVYELR